MPIKENLTQPTWHMEKESLRSVDGGKSWRNVPTLLIKGYRIVTF